MKKSLLTLASFAILGGAFAQCNPADYDWGTLTYGVSPNPTLGETFETAYLGVYFADVIYVKAPTNAQDINATLPSANIDSLALDSITVFNGVADINVSSIGLSVSCNNGGVSPNPCVFLGGGNYCGDITGVPTVAGSFPAKIYVRVFTTIFGQTIAYPYQFTNFTFDVLDPNSVEEAEVNYEFGVSQNYPNPANEYTQIEYSLPSNGDVQLTIFNLVGEKKIDRKLSAKKGINTHKINTNELSNGIYLYTVQSGDRKLTKRLIVQH